jgi:hypothetical protein
MENKKKKLLRFIYSQFQPLLDAIENLICDQECYPTELSDLEAIKLCKNIGNAIVNIRVDIIDEVAFCDEVAFYDELYYSNIF